MYAISVYYFMLLVLRDTTLCFSGTTLLHIFFSDSIIILLVDLVFCYYSVFDYIYHIKKIVFLPTWDAILCLGCYGATANTILAKIENS